MRSEISSLYGRSWSMWRCAVAIVLMAASLPVLAEPHSEDGLESVSDTYTQCIDQSGGVTSEMLDCIHRETVGLLYRLETVARLFNRYDERQLSEISERWTRWARLECKTFSGVEGNNGTRSLFDYNECMMEALADRVVDLNKKALRYGGEEPYND